MPTEVRVPTLGESVSEATVATWFRKPGDLVAVDEMLCELETDKVTVEVPAPAAGRLTEILAPEGTTVGANALLAMITGAGSASPAPPSPDTGALPAAEAAPQANEVNMTDVMVPSLGESVSEATVATWFKKVGDAVAVDEMLCELETDKVSVEVPSPVAGVLSEILAPEGATVDAKARLAIIAEGATASAKAAPAAAAPAPAKTAKDVEDAPAAKKAMAEAGISRDAVQASGRDGRVMKQDVAAAVAAAVQVAPAVAAATPAPPPAPPPPDPRRRRRPRRARQDHPPARHHRAPPERRAEHRRDAHDL
jgi:2-oxoglutarate dehydrogenase E2 component (dihydrolipoamide succinyltransferase)